ncbi:helix-turn-helix domain-containing protein [Maritimibacter sp. DP1N21-5]|uniref:MerR family transcriptional regulator n=1 Tax=Maritimibacter sp. DP1N21-5 TaxID=2836867 RepID=UPI001C45BCCE|nr:helix-turn-helix domain-containing protein [Maritimibacter sp. DP1N21-5]MBV7408078.1 helix-turn-helix domain-containing protein [Maritimibacter sp. DP1N21-5]
MFSIGDLSRRTGVKVPTIRYYEQIGLIAADERTEGNQRRYSPAGLDRLAFIRHARDLGLPLDDIRALLSLDPDDHAATHAIAHTHLAAIRARMNRLRRLEAELQRIVATCDGQDSHDCSVLHAFGDHDLCAHDHGQER